MELTDGYAGAMDAFKQKLAADKPKLATRKASQNALEVINGVLPGTFGGSADLTSSNFTNTSQTLPIVPGDFAGRYMRYGVREHAMAATMNGIALHGGMLPYGGTFLTFTDYARPAIRLSALMKQRVVYVMTHDSIGLGEDGPTHQPVEHLSSLRTIPDLLVLRPADATETLECWQIAIEHKDHPSILALSRQGLPALRTEDVCEGKSLGQGRLRHCRGQGCRRGDFRHGIGSRDCRRRAKGAGAQPGISSKVGVGAELESCSSCSPRLIAPRSSG